MAAACTAMLLNTFGREGRGLNANPAVTSVPCANILFFFYLLTSTVGGCSVIRFFEMVASESAELLRDVGEQLRSEREKVLRNHGQRRWRVCGRVERGNSTFLSERLFRRRLLQVRNGPFDYFEPGAGIGFLQYTRDNVLTYVYMVNFSTPMRMLYVSGFSVHKKVSQVVKVKGKRYHFHMAFYTF